MKKRILVAMTLVLLVCGTAFAGGASESPKASAEPKTVEWWDHFLPLAELHKGLFAESEAETGVPIVYTQYDPAKQNEALLLAFRTNSCPDVFSKTMSVSEVSMYKEGWFSPLAVEKKDLPQYIQDALFEGYTMFDGKVYSFPSMSINHNALLWYHANQLAEEAVPGTFDEARALAKKITAESGRKQYGFIVPIAFTQRMNDTIEDLMMASGSPGWIDWNTGEYQYASDAAFKVFEFFTGLYDDGSVHPASVNLDMRAARERWAAGEAALLMDGAWNIGVVKSSFPEIYDSVGVVGPLRVDASQDYMVYKTPPKGNFFISANSDAVEAATHTLLKFMGEEYYIGLARNMDQPPLDLSAVGRANVHPSYKKLCGIFSETMGYRPDPILGNLNVAQVNTEMREIHPNPAEILQGYYSGAIKDWKSELVKYNDAMTAERARAVKKVQSQGVDVSLDDWIFPNFTYGESFLSDMYTK